MLLYTAFYILYTNKNEFNLNCTRQFIDISFKVYNKTQHITKILSVRVIL